MGGTRVGTRGLWAPDGQSSGTRTLTQIGDTPQPFMGEIRVVKPDEIVINFNATLGEGTYGYVFMAEFTAGEHTGKKAVVKCAISGDDEHSVMAAAYLATESYMNDAVMEMCPNACAPYLGMTTQAGTKFLVWEFVEGATLEELLVECAACHSLQPLAIALGKCGCGLGVYSG